MKKYARDIIIGLLLSYVLVLLVSLHITQYKNMDLNERKAVAQDVFIKLQKHSGVGIVFMELEFSEEDEINAYASPYGIYITNGALMFLNNEDELAAWIGHEIGHYMLGHTDNDFYDGFGDNRIDEANADKFGVYLMVRSGYDICQAKKPWIRLEEMDGNNLLTKSHHSYADRVLLYTFPQCK